jgi:kumamolisin
MSRPDLVPLTGSEPPPAPGTQALGPVDRTEPVEVSVLLRPQRSSEELAAIINQVTAGQRAPLSREEYAAAFGADPAELAAVERFARGQHLEVVEVSPARRTIRLAGTAAAFGAAFGVDLQRYRAADGTSFRAHSGPVRVPAELAGAVQAVLGFDTRPLASPGG